MKRLGFFRVAAPLAILMMGPARVFADLGFDDLMGMRPIQSRGALLLAARPAM